MSISTNTTDNYEVMAQIIDTYNLSGTEVLDLLTDWHGLQLLDFDFMENLTECEGYEI